MRSEPSVAKISFFAEDGRKGRIGFHINPGEGIGLYDTVISQKDYKEKADDIFVNNPTK